MVKRLRAPKGQQTFTFAKKSKPDDTESTSWQFNTTPQPSTSTSLSSVPENPDGSQGGVTMNSKQKYEKKRKRVFVDAW